MLFGRGGAEHMRELATLHGEENIARPGPLQPHTRYSWRVVAVMADATTRAGPTWTFTTGNCTTCSSCTHPRRPTAGSSQTKTTPRPTPPSCAAALDACCGGGAVHKHGGDVRGLGEQCMSHMRRHNASLVDPEAGCELVDEQKFCDPCHVGVPFCDPSCNGMPQRGNVAPPLPGCCRSLPNPDCCQRQPIPPTCCAPPPRPPAGY